MTNIALIVGRLARDPETRETSGGTTVTQISVVTDYCLILLAVPAG